MAHDRPRRGLRYFDWILPTTVLAGLLASAGWTDDAPGAALHALVVTVVGSGTVSKSPDLPSYGDGAVITLTAAASPGSYFTGWSGDAAGTVNPITVTMSTDRNVTATFAPTSSAAVMAISPGGWISPSAPTASIPVQLARSSNEPVAGLSVTFQLDHLALSGSQTVALGAFLGASGAAVGTPVVTDNGGGSFTVDASTQGTPCGSDALSGELFHVNVGSGDLSGVGTLTITSVILRNCGGDALPSSIGSAASVGLDGTPPTVTLTSPNGGEIWLAVSPQTITWNASDAAGLAANGIDLEFSSDDGASWNAIAGGLANSGSYSWTAPGVLTSLARVRVTARDVNGNTAVVASAAPFTLAAATAAALVATPNPSVSSQAVTLTATATTVPPGLGTPTGTITFKDGSGTLASVPLGPGGIASTSVSSLAIGSHTLRANDAGSGLFASSYSTNVTQVVQARVTATAGAHGQIAPTGTQLFYLNNTPAFSFSPDAGYHIATVTVDGTAVAAVSPYTFAPLSANHTIDVQFAINHYTLAAASVGGGSVALAPSQPDYTYGSLVTAQAIPDIGHVFVGWSGDLSGNVNPVGVLMEANKSITATFAASQYSLNIAVLGSGTVSRSPDLPSYTLGTTVTLTATPASGYHFTGWSGDAGGSDNPTTLQMDASKSVTATFALNQYSLDVTLAGAGTVSKSPDLATYAHGSFVSLLAQPAPAQHFVGWSGDAAGSANPITIYMDAAKAVTATFAINQFPVSVSVIGSGTVTPSPSQALYDQGSIVTLTATPAVGYHFVGWSGDASGSALSTTVTVDAAESVTATFAINQYALGISVVGSGSVTPAPNQAAYDHGTGVTLTATPATGYHFVSWTGDASGNSPSTVVTMDGAKAVTATFAIDQYSLDVSVVGNGTVAKAPDRPDYDYGSSVTLTATAATGYHFVSWSGDASGSSAGTTVTVDAPKAVTATFAVNQYALGVTVVGSGTVAKSPDQPAYDHGTVVTLTATPATGYHFVGWSGDANGSSLSTTVTMTATAAVTATFEPNQYAVNVTVAGNGTAAKSPNQATYAFGTSVTLTATPHTGWQFVGWSGSLVSSTNPVVLTIDGDKDVTCSFLVNQYSLTTILVGNGSVTRTPDQASYAHGTTVTLQAVPPTGYHFVSWSGALSGSTNPSSLLMDGNKTVTATFAINSYTLALSSAGNGAVASSPNQATYDHGTSVTLSATPATGYHLSAWSGDLSGAANPATLVMDANKSVTGNFAINSYTLTVATVGSGSVTKSPSQSTYNHGTSVTLTASPSTGYHFVGWSGDASGGSPSTTIDMDANKVVTATFAINTYALNVSVVGGGAVSRSPNQASYSHGVSVTLLATPAAGFHFTGWSGDLTGSANPVLITMDAVKTVTASFAANLLVLSVDIVGRGSVSRSPDELTYAPGTLVTLQAAPEIGYHFDGWAGDLSGSANPATLSMDVNRLVTATFVANISPIAVENLLPGNPSSQWNVVGRGDLSIVGYAADMSVNRGDTQYFKVKTDAPAFHLDIYRMGYYQGNGARRVATIAGTPSSQPDCLTDPASGLIDCGNWSVSAIWHVPADAVSGMYFAKVIREDTQGASHIPFVVRDDASTSDILVQTSDPTWQAYNDYGGNSLYGGTAPFPGGHAAKVSYNRPFTNHGTNSSDNFFLVEYAMSRWFESNGYDVSYICGVDTDRHGDLIPHHRVFAEVGHDEYWSGQQRANVTAARDAGVNLAFFGGNEIYWKTRYENSIDGSSTPYRTLVCYKEGTLGERACGAKCDPAPGIWTGLWRDGCGSSYPPNDGCRPENELSGSISWTGSSGAIQVPATYKSMRFWRNTQASALQSGQSLNLAPGTLGFEWDPEQASDAYPVSRVSLSSTTLGGFTHHLNLYRQGSALVFSAGSLGYCWGLDNARDGGTGVTSDDQRQATANLLAEMGALPSTPTASIHLPTPSGDLTPPASQIVSPADGAVVSAGARVAITGISADAAGSVAKVQVSADGGATWASADGTEAWTYNWTPSATGTAQIRVRATDDWGNLESTGPALHVTVNSTQSYNCPCTVWTASSTPGSADGGEQSAAEVGLKFRAASPGLVRGIRYFKSAANGGTHSGSLWSVDGTRLAQATFTSEGPVGWQEATFSSPVSIDPGVTYVASVFMPQGHFASDGAGLASGMDAGPLHVLANSESANGVFVLTPASAFPTAAQGATNYWVDLDYSDVSTPDVTPPTVVSFSPAAGAAGVSNATSVTATFSEPIDTTSLANVTFTLSGPGGSTIPATISWQPVAKLAVLSPLVPLSYSTTYSAALKGSSTGPSIRDVSGNPMASDAAWSFTTSSPPSAPPDDGPGGPILVISTAASPFSRYYAEILRAEGLNEFTAKDLSLVTPAVLAGYDVVLLGQAPLSATQATMFSNWVTTGGTLIAMRPDVKLAPLLGLVAAGDSVANGYLKVNATTDAGAGITPAVIQYHGAADRYSLSGATCMAWLYTNATTGTAYSLISRKSVGTAGGLGVAFSFDLARSVIYTRQGNPAWVGQNRTGLTPESPSDLFYGASAADPQQDWVDLSRVDIPQADEQQRLLTNLIVLGNLHRKPLPRLWYLPSGKKAAVVVTGKNHGGSGVADQFEVYRAASPEGCSLDDWECVRATAYQPVVSVLTPAQALFYQGAGFDIAPHVDTGCQNVAGAALDSAYTTQLAQFESAYPNIPPPLSARTICSPWSDWSGPVEIETAHLLRLDTHYQFRPLTWVADRPGLFTGSALPMRFARTDGSLIDCYQLAVQMTEESGQSYPRTPDSLFARAVDSRGYYGVFAANLSFDGQPSSASNAIVASAQAFGIPIVSASQMLTWLDARGSTAYSNLSWDGSHLGFTVTAPSTAQHLETMLPLRDGNLELVALALAGAPVAYTVDIIKGVACACFESQAGAYVATYQIDTAPPALSDVVVSPDVAGGSAVVTWTSNELADSRVDYGPSATNMAVSSAALVFSHSVEITGLTPGTTYFYRVTSLDPSGHPNTSPALTLAPATFSTPQTPCFVDETDLDFGAGSKSSTYVSKTSDGELMLLPAVATEFDQLPADTNWVTELLDPAGSVSVQDGVLHLSRARLDSKPVTGFGPGRSLEFVATFSPIRVQDLGFGAGDSQPLTQIFEVAPWAMFSTGEGEFSLLDRTWSGGAFLDHELEEPQLGYPHRFRIHWTSTAVEYYVDGVLLHSQAASIAGPMRASMVDEIGGDDDLTVDWLRMTPYASSGTFESRVFNAGTMTLWNTVNWVASVPGGTTLYIDVRAGNTPHPDGTWTPYSNVVSAGATTHLVGQYVQYRARLSTADAEQSPVLASLGLGCDRTFGTVGSPDQHAPNITMARPPMPNPSSGQTAFEYAVGTDLAGGTMIPVALTLYDLQGRSIRQVVHTPQAAGRYRAIWNAAGDDGHRVSAGVYYYRLTIGRFNRSGKVVVLR